MFSHLIPASGFYWRDWPGPLSYVGNGPLAVDVFIILSGFVIFLLLDNKQESYGTFIVRRFFRLFPVYVVCLLAAAFTLDIAGHAIETLPFFNPVHLGWKMNIEAGYGRFAQHLGAHLTMLHGLLPDRILPRSQYAMLPTAWSVSLEWQFYLVAPIIYWLCRRGPSWFACILGAATLANLAFRFSSHISFLPAKIHFFMTGIASYYLWTWRGRIQIPDTAWTYIPPTAAAVCFLTSRSLPLTIWTLVFLAVMGNTPAAAILRIEPLRYLGKISYSIYLSHLVIMHFVLAGINHLPVNRWTHFVLLSCVVTVVTLAMSDILYRWVEAPGIALGKRLTATSSVSAVPLRADG